MPRKISILGATGSIGQNTIDLIRRAPDAYEVVALTGAGNIAQFAVFDVAAAAAFPAHWRVLLVPFPPHGLLGLMSVLVAVYRLFAVRPLLS